MRRLFLPLLLLLAALCAAPRAEAAAPALGGPAAAALACAQQALGLDEAADCLRALATSAELREAIACALRGKEALGCLGLELGLLGACVLAAGGSLEAAAGCVALRLAGQEAAKCVAVGIGVPGGCFGPGNEFRRIGRALADPGALLLRARARAAGFLPRS